MRLADDRAQKTYFGDVLSTISAENKLSQRQLAELTDFSQPTISRIERGDRPLSQRVAAKFGTVLGGTTEKWLEVYEQTKEGSELPIAFFRDFLLGRVTEDDLPGVRIRRMCSEDINRFFAENEDGEMEFRGIVADCEISDFSPQMVKKTSYDTRAGSFFQLGQPEKATQISEADAVIFKPGQSKVVCTLEHISLPPWLEADIHPASNIALKGLIVANGPIIDPGYQGFLRVLVFNPTEHAVKITATEPFMTLRFWMQDNH